MIEYTAKRSLATGHVEGEVYSFDVDVMEATPEVRDIKESARSPGGATETTFERQDTYWSIKLAPVSGSTVDQLREFLDSIESGETFRVWLHPSDVEPLVLKMEGDAGSESAFMRGGSAAADLFTGEFTALEVDTSDSTDIYTDSADGDLDP